MKKRILSLLLALVFVLSATPVFAASEPMYTNMNAEMTSNGPKKVKQITLNGDDPVLVEKITTYHWNDGLGTEQVGKISIWEGNSKLGEWQAKGRNYYGLENVYWDVTPNFIMMPGHSYSIRVSDFSTWSYNEASGNCGMFELYGSYQKNFNGSGTSAKLDVVRSPQKLTVNGKNQTTEIYNIGGTNFFKLRDLAAMLNGTDSQFNVDYDASRNMIVVKTGVPYTTATGQELRNGPDNSSLAVKSAQSMMIDGKTVNLTAYNIGGANFFGLRELSAYVGYEVGYDAATNTAIVATADGGSGGNAAANVTLSLAKSVYAPGDTITVKYSGVTQQLIASGAWIGMAGANNAASEHLSQGDYVRSESGTITMKAPKAAGSYQVRFFKGQGATADNLVSSASASFTVVVPAEDKLPDADFTTHMYVINEGDGKGTGKTNHPDAYVTAKDGKVTIKLDAISYTWHADTTMENPFDESEIGGDGEYRRSEINMTGEITGVMEKTDSYGDKYIQYAGMIDSFTPFEYYNFTDSYLGGDDGTTTSVRYTPHSPMSQCTFTLRVYEDSHKQISITLAGDSAGTRTEVIWGESKTTGINGIDEQILYPFRLGESGNYIYD